MAESVIPHQLADLVKNKADGMINLVIRGLFDDLCALEVQNTKKTMGSTSNTTLANAIQAYVRNKLILHRCNRRFFGDYSEHATSFEERMWYYNMTCLVQAQKAKVKEMIAEERQFFGKTYKV